MESDDRCISYKELKTLVHYSRMHINRLEWEPQYMGDDPFPVRVRLGNCRVCWWLSEVTAWIKRRSSVRIRQRPPKRMTKRQLRLDLRLL